MSGETIQTVGCRLPGSSDRTRPAVDAELDVDVVEVLPDRPGGEHELVIRGVSCTVNQPTLVRIQPFF